MTLTLKEAITAIQSGDTALGKKLLAQLLLQNPDDDMAWIWMSATVDEPEQRHYCLQKALEINPANATARAGMARLGLELPDAPPPPPALARVDHALGIPDVPPEGSPAQTPAFFWPPRHEASEEAPIVEETFIGDIVAAMNKDENGAPAPADTELDWLFQPDAAEAAAERETEQGLRDMFSSLGDGALEMQSGPVEAEPAAEKSIFDFPEEPVAGAIELPESGESIAPFTLETGEAVELPEPAPEYAPVLGAGQMWHNPTARADRLVALTDRYLISANPDPANLPEIELALPTGQLPRRALGRGARVFPLERITCLRAPEKRSWLEVSFMRNKDTRTQTINLGKIKTRDELFEALQTRLAMDFRASVQKNGLWDMLFVPVLTLIVLGLITGLLFYGSLQALADPHMLSAWLSPSTEAWLQSDAAANLPYAVLLVGGGLMLLGLAWLWGNLRRPRRTQVLERIAEVRL